MKRAAIVLVWLAALIASCRTAPDPGAEAVTRDRLEIRSVKFLNASSPEFVVIVVTADYALASSPEGNLELAFDLGSGVFTPVAEQRIRRGAGAVELMAACKRVDRTRRLSLSLAEFPGNGARRTFASRTRAVVLPALP